MLEAGGYGLTGDLGLMARLGRGGRDVADGLQKAPVSEPIHPFEHGKLHRLGRALAREGPHPDSRPLLARAANASG